MYGTIAAAVLAALGQAMDVHTCQEQGGAIIQEVGGSYVSTAPTRGDDDNVMYVVKVKAGEKLVAIWHVHPGCSEGTEEYFSGPDVVTARQLGVTSYVGVRRKREVIVFEPRTDRWNAAGSKGRLMAWGQ